MEATLIFPHQLFDPHPALHANRPIYLFEEWLFFRQYAFHQQKLVLHRASMRAYDERLMVLGYQVHYIESIQKESDIREWLKKNKSMILHIADVHDDWLQRRLAASGNTIRWYRTPAFLNTANEGRTFFEGRSYFQTDFYKAQRKQRNLLMEGVKPLGSKWSFDDENRLKLPKEVAVPKLPLPKDNPFVAEARQYVSGQFSKNYGAADAPFPEAGKDSFYPVTHEEAKTWLKQFLKLRLQNFGAYEDAQSKKHPVLFHSLLSPLLNIGLLTPQQVLNETLEYASEHAVPLNSLEGFVRQLVGWREYIRIMYALEERQQRTTNYWGFSRKIPEAFWKGTTGIEPIDQTVRKVLSTGYCHHIERLMVLGNFFLLCEFDPDEVYRWFMELFIDSYDWVMVPNVYAMTQFADGGKMMTKPYISGSNYLMKMGDWNKGPWQEVWDGLFWRFMHVHRNFFLQNPRLGMLVRSFDKMAEAKRKAHLKTAEVFLKKLDDGALNASTLF